MHAATHGHQECVQEQELLEAGASSELRDQHGCTALQAAEVNPHAAIVEPSNGSSARLADFGLARAAKRQESAAPGASVASASGVKRSAAFLDPI